MAERISFDDVAEAHRYLEAGGLEGKLVLCPDLPSRRDQVLPQREPTSVQATPATLRPWGLGSVKTIFEVVWRNIKANCSLFDDLVGDAQNVVRHGQPNRLGGLEVD